MIDPNIAEGIADINRQIVPLGAKAFPSVSLFDIPGVEEEFPIEALPAVMRDMALSLGEVYAVPPMLPGLCALGVAAGTLGKGWWLTGAVNGHGNYGNLYLVLVLPPATGKSSIAKALISPLSEWENERERKWKEEDLPALQAEAKLKACQLSILFKPASSVSKEERDALAREVAALEKKLKFNPALITEDTTTESLERDLGNVANETQFVFSTDGGKCLSSAMGQYRSGKNETDCDLWLKAFTSDEHKSSRVTRDSVSLKAPLLSILLLIQPNVWGRVQANEDARDRGLFTRILPVSLSFKAVADDGVIRELNSGIKEAWRTRIREILQLRFEAVEHGCPKEIRCSDGAREVVRAFHNEGVVLTNCSHADLRGELGRWREQVLRLAVVIAVMENPICCELSVEVATRAVRLVRWIVARGYDLNRECREAAVLDRRDRLIQVLHNSGGECTTRDLERRNTFTEAEIRQLSALFPSVFAIEVRMAGAKGGRPSEFCRLLV